MHSQHPGSFWNVFSLKGRLTKRHPRSIKDIPWRSYYESLYRIVFYAVLAVVVGVLTGAVDALFGRGLLYLNDLRDLHPLYFLPFLGLAGLVIMWVYMNFGGKATKGMGLIFAVGYEADNTIPLRMIPLTIFGTWMTHLFGGSAGREGVAVQIGATVSMAFSRFLPKGEHQRILLLSGMAAGMAGLFGTPMAGTFFALEVLVVGSIFYEALVPALVAAWVASFTSRALGLEHMYGPTIHVGELTPKHLATIIVAGLCFGLVGKLFSSSLYYTRLGFAKLIHNPMLRIGIIGVILSVLFMLFDMGRYSGLSETLYVASFWDNNIYAWDWLLKLAFTVVTLACGFQGGELTPCFVVGASLGCVLASALGMPGPLLAACGAVAVFGSATNTLLAPIFIGVEIFGSEALPYFFIACVTAYVIAGHGSIYVGQKELNQILSYQMTAKTEAAVPDVVKENKKEDKTLEESYE